MFSKKYCPSWVYDCVVAQTVSDFILYGVDLVQPCRKFAHGLSELYEEVSLEELVRSSESMVEFLHHNKVNEHSTDLLSNFAYYRFHYTSKTNRRKFGGIFKTSLYDDLRNYSGAETLKSMKAYYFETRSEVAISGSPGWSLATQTEMPELQEIAKNSSFKANPIILFEPTQLVSDSH